MIDLTISHKEKRRERNFLSVHRGKSISRILPLSRLFESFRDNTVYFPAIYEWEDPYEGFLYKLEFRDHEDIPIDFRSWLENTFGQCWSYGEEYDASWKIYGKNDKDQSDCAVKIEIDLYDYYSNLYDVIPTSELLFYATDVKYENKSYFVNISNNITWMNILDTAGPIYLMGNILNIKRKEFAYEKEIRFMYAPTSNITGYGNPGVTFSLDMKPLVKKVIFPPTTTVPDFGLQRKKLLTTGFTGEVQISTLYEFDLPHHVGGIKLDI